jgi:hypothetical protein
MEEARSKKAFVRMKSILVVVVVVVVEVSAVAWETEGLS